MDLEATVNSDRARLYAAVMQTVGSSVRRRFMENCVTEALATSRVDKLLRLWKEEIAKSEQLALREIEERPQQSPVTLSEGGAAARKKKRKRKSKAEPKPGPVSSVAGAVVVAAVDGGAADASAEHVSKRPRLLAKAEPNGTVQAMTKNTTTVDASSSASASTTEQAKKNNEEEQKRKTSMTTPTSTATEPEAAPAVNAKSETGSFGDDDEDDDGAKDDVMDISDSDSDTAHMTAEEKEADKKRKQENAARAAAVAAALTALNEENKDEDSSSSSDSDFGQDMIRTDNEPAASNFIVGLIQQFQRAKRTWRLTLVNGYLKLDHREIFFRRLRTNITQGPV